MGSRRRRGVAHASALLLASLPLLAGTRDAGAQAPRVVRVDYEAAAGCPDAKSFEGQLRARSTKTVVSADASSVVRVRIAARGGRFEGEVGLTDVKGRESRRQVDGTCSDVTAALALITALALDPTASTAPTPPLEPSEAASSGAPPSPPPLASSSTPAPPRPAPSPTEERDARGSEPINDAVARTHGWGWSIGADVEVASGVTPSPFLSFPAFVEVWRRTESLFSPSLRLRFARADSGDVFVGSSGAGADFTLTTGSIDLCPLGWTPAGWLRASVCARGEGGLVAASGVGVTPARSDQRAWVTAGLALRLRAGIVGALFVELEGYAFAPLVRDRFFVEPDATVQRAPAVAGAGAAGVGVTFW